MPIYEYECLSCDKRTEILQRFDEAPLTTCPECGGEVKKLLSAPAFQFKGSGWYVTDYAGKKGREAKSESKGDGGGEKASGGEKAAEASKPAESKAAAATGKASSGE
jgi:putative FmdB family regulatory protein